MTHTDKKINLLLKDYLYDIISNITKAFDDNEIAFLSFQEKIETTMRNKIAWKLQLALDALYDRKEVDHRYLVRVEWTPKPKSRSKCDMAVLRLSDDTNQYTQCIAMFEYKAHSMQRPEQCFIDEYEKDHAKLLDFRQSESLVGTKDVDLYYIFFLQLHLSIINKYELACTYLEGTNNCFGRKPNRQNTLDKDSEMQKLHNYWNKMFKTSTYDVIENNLGTYFHHQSFLETVVYKL